MTDAQDRYMFSGRETLQIYRLCITPLIFGGAGTPDFERSRRNIMYPCVVSHPSVRYGSHPTLIMSSRGWSWPPYALQMPALFTQKIWYSILLPSLPPRTLF